MVTFVWVVHNTKTDANWIVINRNPPVRSVPEQLTAPSQRETLQHLQRERGHFYNSHATTCLTRSPEAGVQGRLISIRLASSRGYLDHLLRQSRGLSNPAAGLFRRVPSRPSSPHLSPLHGSALGTSYTAAGQCGRPRCCRGFPPECSGLGVVRGKGQKGKAVIISMAMLSVFWHHCVNIKNGKTPPLFLEEPERRGQRPIMRTSDKLWQPLPQWWLKMRHWVVLANWHRFNRDALLFMFFFSLGRVLMASYTFKPGTFQRSLCNI